MSSAFASIMSNLDSQMKTLQKQFIVQSEEFEKKQQSMMSMEQEFEKNILEENEKFTKKMQDQRQKIQAENRIEEMISKQTTELKRKSSITNQIKNGSAPEYKQPMIIQHQRQNSSKTFKKSLKSEENNEEKQMKIDKKIEEIGEKDKKTEETREADLDKEKIPYKMILNLLKAFLFIDVDNTGRMDPYCKFTMNAKTFKSKVCEDEGKTPTWNQSFEIFEDFTKELQIQFKVMDKNVVASDKLVGDGFFILKSHEFKNQEKEIGVELTKGKNITGKLYVKFDFIS